MKNKGKKKAVITAVMAAAVLLSACGNKEYLKDIKADKYVTLGSYTGVSVSVQEPVVQDELVEMYIEYYILPGYATQEELTDGIVELGDTVNIDYTGYHDGTAFEGGTAEGALLTIGSQRFIAGFEDGLIGASVGDKVSLDLSFPDPYTNNPALAGEPVVFEVTVNSISRPVLPELTDELVATMNIDNCKTVKDLQDLVYNDFYEEAVQNYENTIETTITDTIMSGCTFKEPPAKMVERLSQNLKDAMSAQATVQGMTLADYMKEFYKLDVAAYEEKFKTEALAAAQQYIMFQAIADVEGLNPTEEQIQEEVTSRTAAFNYESEEEYKKNMDMEMLKEQVMRRNVMNFLKENSNIETVPAAQE